MATLTEVDGDADADAGPGALAQGSRRWMVRPVATFG